MKIVTAQDMRQAEAAANAAGLSYAKMMENAGSSVAQEITRRMSVQDRSVLVLVGPGNNGGDGLLAARYLQGSRARVQAFLWQARPDGDANLKLVRDRAIPVIVVEDEKSLAALAAAAAKADVIVDALLGTGVARPIEGMMKAMLDVVKAVSAKRETAAPVVAIDVPSGLNADTGAIDPAALPADITVTFSFPKRGHYLFPGAAYVGELVVADIGIPQEAMHNVPLDLADAALVRALLPARPRDAHKGTFGKLLVVAGSLNYTGAAFLATMGAYRVGAGLVTLAVARSIQLILAAKTSEVTFLPLPEAELGFLSADSLPVLCDAARNYDAVLIGCGLSSHPQTQALVVQLVDALREMRMPLLIDADGLNALATTAQWWQKLPAGAVLTPHPGEMSRLSGVDVPDIAGDRIGVATHMAATWKAVLVLKGAYSIVAAPDGQATVNPFANPALATAGTGDVLAGVIAGLLTQHVAPYAAAIAGAYLHAAAAEIVGRSIGDSGMIASDLLGALPLAMHIIRHPQQSHEQDD